MGERGEDKGKPEDDEDAGCPRIMSTPPLLLGLTVGIAVFIAIFSVMAVFSVSGIPTRAEAGERCGSLEVSYCQRLFAVDSSDCPTLQGCSVSGSTCICAALESGAGAEGEVDDHEASEGGAGFADYFFMLCSLVFIGISVWTITSSPITTEAQSANPVSNMLPRATMQPMPPYPHAQGTVVQLEGGASMVDL
jgi:hypothetical protein